MKKYLKIQNKKVKKYFKKDGIIKKEKLLKRGINFA